VLKPLKPLLMSRPVALVLEPTPRFLIIMAPALRRDLQPSVISSCLPSLPSPACETTANLTAYPNPYALAPGP
jgi:hypothetical protein